MIRAASYVQLCDVPDCNNQRLTEVDDFRSGGWVRWITSGRVIDLCPDHKDLDLDKISNIAKSLPVVIHDEIQ